MLEGKQLSKHGEAKNQRPSPASRAARWALQAEPRAELFHTPGADGIPYATIAVDGHLETWPIHSTIFRHELERRVYRATGRGLYCTKDTFVTTSLNAGVKIAWLEQQTGVAYATLRRHYGKWMPSEGESELLRFAALDPGLFTGQIVSAGRGRADTIFASGRKSERRKVRKGGLEPPRVFSPQDPESCASANSAT